MTSQFKIKDPAEMAIRRQPMAGHPGAFIRNVLLPEYGLSVTEAARRIGVQRVGFIGTLDGKYSVTRDLAYKLGALMRDEVTDLLIAWQQKYDLEREAEQRAAYRRDIERVPPVAVAA
ncbi:helix-turn-helix transcriptional regulator [Sphingomonas sp. ERG5]|uniref:helix-turn-helix transcriptional regulator n=1 Tax=Sphingomonas sp. ERG5 TaxID=1381597 RepID=UPI00054BE8C7|nr:hypothetical protein [Sphingomonas sp. ERG5]